MKTIPLLAAWLLFAPSIYGSVRVEDVPEKGLQPEVAVGKDGVVHLVYLSGEPKACQVRYTWRKPGQPWQPSRTVNTISSSAIALGSIRGPQLALGRQGAVHVIWNGVSAPESPHAPLWYSRKIGEGNQFEPQRDLLGQTTALDGGASVAADGKGKVFVVWHGNLSGGATEENQRLVFVRKSEDEGGEFGKPDEANISTPGVCACCSLRVFTDPQGVPKVFFRNAVSPDYRAMTILSMEVGGWKSREVENWHVTACPMSSAALIMGKKTLLGAWETEGKIRAGFIEDPSASPLTLAPKGGKHPTMATNGAGKVLVAWVEGSGWNRGGDAVWTELDENLKPAALSSRAPGVPAWGRVAAYAEADGNFVLLR